jgi:hypothetical protein
VKFSRFLTRPGVGRAREREGTRQVGGGGG